MHGRDDDGEYAGRDDGAENAEDAQRRVVRHRQHRTDGRERHAHHDRKADAEEPSRRRRIGSR